jgi:hypothetical protein
VHLKGEWLAPYMDALPCHVRTRESLNDVSKDPFLFTNVSYDALMISFTSAHLIKMKA